MPGACDEPVSGLSEGPAEPIRLDKWLWHARLCKTRALAAKLVSSGHVRVNGQRVSRPGRRVGPGDTLTLVQHGQVRVLHIRAPGTRRGPAPEARALYDEPGAGPTEDQAQDQAQEQAASPSGEGGTGVSCMIAMGGIRTHAVE